MNDKFFDLKKEKQDRIINAALKVFSQEAFKRASTDEIVKEAGISKGLLFHYFESKQGLYEFIFDYSIRYMTMELSGAIGSSDRDPFTIYRKHVRAEQGIMGNYPYMTSFISNTFSERDGDVRELQKDGRRLLDEIIENHRSQMNFGTVKSVDEDMLIDLMNLALDGIRRRTTGDLAAFSKQAKECIEAFEKMCS